MYTFNTQFEKKKNNLLVSFPVVINLLLGWIFGLLTNLTITKQN